MRYKRSIIKIRRGIRSFEHSWNESTVWPIVLIGVALGAAIWIHLDPQSPGLSIGLLALAAGIMSVRPKMPFLEKLAWVAILVTFMYQEVKAIRQNDTYNKSIRDSQNTAFGLIVDDLKTSIGNSKQQYKETLDHVDRVSDHVDEVSDHVDGMAQATQIVAEIARTNLLAVTGGNSYAFIYPSLMADGSEQLKIHNTGDQSLTDVRITLSEILQDSKEPGCDPILRGHIVFTVGPLAPHEGRIVQNADLVPNFNAVGIARYQIWINAQNAGVTEQLEFRRVQGDPYLQYKFALGRPVVGKKTMPGDEHRCGIYFRWLKKQDWTTTYMTSAVEDPAKLKPAR